MSAPTKLAALVIDPDIVCRSTLKTAALALNTFTRVHPLSTFREAFPVLESGGPWDVVFIAQRLGDAAIEEFTSQIREHAWGRDLALIAVLPPRHQDGAEIGTQLLRGTDGFLLEPYSVDGIREISELSVRLKVKRAEERQRAALTLMLREVAGLVDQRAMLQKKGRKTEAIEKRIRERMLPVARLGDAGQKLYFDVLCEILEALPPPPRMSYTGPSERVRQKLQEKFDKEQAETMKKRGF